MSEAISKKHLLLFIKQQDLMFSKLIPQIMIDDSANPWRMSHEYVYETKSTVPMTHVVMYMVSNIM